MVKYIELMYESFGDVALERDIRISGTFHQETWVFFGFDVIDAAVVADQYTFHISHKFFFSFTSFALLLFFSVFDSRFFSKSPSN